MPEKYHLLFTFMVGKEDNKDFLWLLVNGSLEEIEKHSNTYYKGENDRLVHVTLDKPYTGTDRMFTIENFNSLFMGEDKITMIPHSVIKMRDDITNHISSFPRILSSLTNDM